jgi:hypothetical protein
MATAEVLVMAGTLDSVMNSVWVAGLPTPLLAVIVTGKVPVALAGGLPAIVAVPLTLSENESPGGRFPEMVRFGVGDPEAVTVKVL